MHHVAHNFGAMLAVGIAVLTALAIIFWGAISNNSDPEG